jgi:sec-independent protein translocase protein TatA
MTALLAFLPGGWELWIILGIALLLFGHRLPGMARSLGSSIIEFKKGLKSGSEDENPPKQIDAGGDSGSTGVDPRPQPKNDG